MNLLDLAPAKATVKVGAHSLSVSALSIEVIAGLCRRFPGLVAVLSGGEFSPVDLVAGGAGAAIIAAGSGYPQGHDDAEKAEAAAAALSASSQLDVIAEIVKLTFPGGARPFAARIAQLVGALSGDDPQTSSQTSQTAPTS